jgi:hypothetical protein
MTPQAIQSVQAMYAPKPMPHRRLQKELKRIQVKWARFQRITILRSRQHRKDRLLGISTELDSIEH